MRSRAALIGIVCLSAIPDVARQGIAQDAADEQVEQLLQSVAAGEEFEGDTAAAVPMLIRTVERGEPLEADLAIRALGMLKADAAVPVLCQQLDHPGHSLRSVAVDALVAIGEESVASVRALIDSPSGRTRAAAIEVLGRLEAIDLTELEGLGRDPDPRVRAAVVNALSEFGRPAVPQLASFLTDPEVPAAVEAARGLQSNRTDPSIAVPGLIEALSRLDVVPAAADVLADYGTEARRAVPALIEAYRRSDSYRYGRPGVVEYALEHIGPPDVRDIPALCECLALDDEEIQILVAESLALMGEDGRSAARALEAALEPTIERYLDLKRKYGSNSYDWRDNSGRVHVALESMAAAIWHVTHDPDRFLKTTETIVLGTNVGVRYSHPSPWEGFSAEECLLIEPWLRSDDPRLRSTALVAAPALGVQGEPLADAIIELAQSEDAELSGQAIQALASIGPLVADEAAPIVLARYRDGTIPLKDFANVVGRMEIRSDESQAILESGLRGGDQWTTQACARAMSVTTNRPDETAALIIESAGRSGFKRWDAVDALQQMAPAAGDLILPYLVRVATYNEYWTRHNSIEALGQYGDAAASAIPVLERQLDDEYGGIRLAAAKSIFQISGDASPLTRELTSTFADEERDNYLDAIRTIAELGRSGAAYLELVSEALHEPPEGYETELIDALKAIGNDGAVAALEETAESTDWVLRSQALAALAELRDAEEPGDN